MSSPSAGRSGIVITRNQCVFLFLLGIIGMTQIPWLRWRETRDAVICDHLDHAYAEFRELRDRTATNDEWQKFSERTSFAIAPFVEELSHSATSLRPVRQRLLFLTRDHLPKLISTARIQPNHTEDEFTASLNEVRTLLGGKLPESMQVSGDDAVEPITPVQQ